MTYKTPEKSCWSRQIDVLFFVYCLNNLIIYTIVSHHNRHVNMYIGVYKKLLLDDYK